MKRMFTLNSKSRSRWMLLLLFLLAGVTDTLAQNVTIGPDNGSMITGQAGGNTDDSGIKRGMAAMWRHEQLALTMTTSDIANLTSAGELADPSCAIDQRNGKLIIGAGQTQTFIVVSLPKGYRITRYRLVLQPDVSGTFTLHSGKNSWAIGTDDQMSFYETPAWSSGSPYGDNTHSTQLTCPDAIATATASDGTTVMQNNNATNRSKEFVIERTSQTETDMTNQLHFFFARATSQYAVSINSFEIWFTAEGTFEAEMTPVETGEATDYVKSPFTTSKMDIGAVNYTNNLYTYDYTGVRDLKAEAHLYQANAVSAGKPANISGGAKHIYPLEIDGKGVYAFGTDSFFVEPPTTIRTTSGWESPIGFRVIGAKFKYEYGTATPAQTITIANGLYITYNNRYLNGNLDFVSANNVSNRFVWKLDEYGNIYAGDDENRQYLACFGEGDDRILSLSSAATGHEATWNLRRASNGTLYYLSDGGNYYYLNVVYIQEGADYHYRGHVTKNATSNLANSSTQNNQTHTVTIPAFTPGAYTLKVYDKTGSQVVKTIRVESNADAGEYTLTGLNNDAVKFAIAVDGYSDENENNPQALVTVTLLLQALNPYINSMDIVCKDAIVAPELQMAQTFTASDFRVSGGEFLFYVPEKYINQTIHLSFENLYSNYGDNTYYGQTSSLMNSRYSFVTSPYFEANKDLYAEDYSPDSDYETKIATSTAGNIRFEFNNAEELTSGSSGEGKVLREYAFDYDKYLTTTDPDGSGKTGEYIACEVKAGDGTQEAGTFFVFTADETRYNIAPTTALQHRGYAFYRMDIKVVAKDFVPDFTWKKVYDKACYDKNGTDGEDSMWGVKLGTTEVNGYLSYEDIINKLNEDIADTSKETADSLNQILYIDGTDLLSMNNDGTNTITTLKSQLGANALIFLPKNQTSQEDNVAYLTQGGSFMAGNDIVLTDKQPFFSPYEIQVDAANHATYSRQITVDANGMVQNATVMLPFTLALNGGVHTNAADVPGANTSFTVNTMAAGQELQKLENSEDYYRAAYFTPFTESLTVANKPYMIRIDSYADEDNSIIFVASQKGSKILATPESTTKLEGAGSTGNYFTGESVNATFDNGTYTFTNKGSYSGLKFDRADSEQVFYFAANRYYDLRTLTKSKRYLYVYPFRAAYAYQTPASPAKMLRGLFVSYDEPLGGTTGINDATAEAELMVRPGKGTLTMTATRAQAVAIHTISGVNVNRVQLNAGETQVVNLPAGVYVVNNVKIVVK